MPSMRILQISRLIKRMKSINNLSADQDDQGHKWSLQAGNKQISWKAHDGVVL